MADRCRCHLPLDPPDGPYWWPSRDPEPAAAVRVVACYGQDPKLLRAERVDGGWHTEGAFAIHPEHTPPRPDRGDGAVCAGQAPSTPWWT